MTWAYYDTTLAPWYRDQLARWNVRVVTAPTVEPVTLAEARLHCRVDPYPVEGSPTLETHPDDDLISTLISAAREWCEAYTGRALAPQVVEVSHSGFPAYYDQQLIKLPMAPVRTIQSVTYRDDEGFDVMLAADVDYVVDSYGYVPHVLPPTGVTWPSLTAYPNSVRVRYEAGYQVEGAESPNVVPMIPSSIKAAIKLIVGELYRHRENSSELQLDKIPMGAEALLRPYRLHLGVA